MKSLKKRWESELDMLVPALDDDVKNAPIVLPETAPKAQAKPTFFEKISGWIAAHKKRFFAGLATCTAAIVALCIAIPLFNTPAESGALVVEINPRAVFSVDEKGNVTAVVATNMDADVILSDEERVGEMTGQTVEKATEIFVDYAARLGYLDLSAQTAIRVSGCGKDVTEEVSDTLETYFREKGAYIAVLAEEMENDAFCRRAGITVKEKTSELTESIRNLPVLYSERESAESKRVLTEQVQALETMIALNERIEEHEDNPCEIFGVELPVKDYWTAQEMQTEYTEAFGALMSEMETALAAYAQNHKETIDDAIALVVKKAEKEQRLSALELSETLAEYVAQIKEYFQSRLEEYREIYESIRATITKTDYSVYIDGLIEEYGSLAAYWDNLKNN